MKNPLVPDEPLKQQVRDPREAMSAFGVVSNHFKRQRIEDGARAYVALACPHLSPEQQEPVVAKVIKATRKALGE